MSEWITYELMEVTEKIGSGATPRGGKESYKDKGISLIRSQNIIDFYFSYSGLAFIDNIQAQALKNVEVKPEDILINITGDSVARVAKVPAKVLPARVNQHVAILRANKEKLDPDYLLYYLLNPVIKSQLLKIASDGATRNALTKSDLEELLIKVPDSLQKQKEISRTLSLLDQKIELLRQQNQTLEELAQTIFKRWFVEFNFPDKEGNPYMLSGGKMKESELGEIPEGWRSGKLGELASLKSGFAFKSDDFVQNDNPRVIKIKDLKGDGIVDLSEATPINNDITASTRVQYFKLNAGDIVLAMSGNTTGKLGIIPPHENELYLNQRVGKFFIKENRSRSFIYNFLMSSNYEDRILSMGYGSAQPNINPNQIDNIEIIFPTENMLSEYVQISEPIYSKVLKNSKEIQTITKLKDILLPKLMGGKLLINNLDDC